MENLPKNVINKIMFYTSHPVADLVRKSPMFYYMKLRSAQTEPSDSSKFLYQQLLRMHRLDLL